MATAKKIEDITDHNDNEPTPNPEGPKCRTPSATKTRMHGHEGPGLHYKHVRTTITLLTASTIFRREFSSDEQKAIREIEKLNFDLSAMSDTFLEHVYAKLDDELLDRVRGEFEFVPRIGSIRDHGACVATCALCGKGDSKDDGSNADKLRYDFRLQNTVGGDDLWVGSNCIVNFALKVRGAETSEEARAILERSLREHISLWKKEAWRAEHADHADIPEHYLQLERLTHDFRYYGRFGRMEREIELLGLRQNAIYWKCREHLKGMRAAMRFYQRSSYLTPAKEDAWKKTKLLLWSLRWLTSTLDRATDLYGEQRWRFLREAREARERKLAELRSKKKPRAMD